MVTTGISEQNALTLGLCPWDTGVLFWYTPSTHGITITYIYIWYLPDTLVAQVQWYVMWEELSVNHFLKHSNHLKRTLKMLLLKLKSLLAKLWLG